MMQATLKKFGYPGLLVKEYQYWRVLVRSGQVTLGSLILICREEVTAFSQISKEAHNELKIAIQDIERILNELFGNKKINYLMLMMHDPEVHFHVLPRYSEDKEFSGIIFKDAGWPNKPDLEQVNEVSQEILDKLTLFLKDKFNA